MRSLICLLAAAAALASAHASAEVYKWVDKNGRIHYSDQIPDKGARVLSVGDRLSLYSPEPAVAQALQAGSGRNAASAALAERVATLERQLQSERLARQSVDARAAYDRCVADRRTDCDQLLSGVTPSPAVSNRPTALRGSAASPRPARAS
jgi:uncharacterized protein DUF4124